MRTLLELTEDPNFLQYEGVNNLTGLAIAYLMQQSGFKDLTSDGYHVNKHAHLGEHKTKIYDTLLRGGMEPFWRNVIDYIEYANSNKSAPRGILGESTIKGVTGIDYAMLKQNPKLVDTGSLWIQVIESNWHNVPSHLFDAFDYAIVEEQDEAKRLEYQLKHVKVLSMVPNDQILSHIQHRFRRIDVSRITEPEMKETYALARKFFSDQH
jgi:hypothetical protein